jgi:predicted transglutaminase-like cysteine proteinase
VAQQGAFGLGWSITVLVGQRLPLFTPEALGDPKQEKFYSICGLCGKGQACQIPRHLRSLSLECPQCQRIYAMVAADTHGQFRYVNEYLTGYAPPAHYPRGQSKLAELMAIWRAVTSECRYTPDAGDDDNDAWQTAQETQALGTGDCEDSSILLADWLLSRGFRARVALGRYAERGGHAWVVVRLDDQDYLLESTEGTSRAQRPPLLSEVGSRYVPELLFDRLALFIRTQPNEPWNGDFWSEATWQRVAPRARPAKDDATIGQANTDSKDHGGL